MVSQYDQYISKELLYGKDFKKEKVIHCGQGFISDDPEKGDSIFIQTVDNLKQNFVFVP